ncbi:MAG: SiaB family protein kinase [Bacteroidales bacterium]|nr:SiaB family protein kinase [Bacteroidales bacterium]
MMIAKEYQDNSLMIYKGAFTVNLISILGNQIRLLPEIDFKLVQKIFRIFMELTQNVSYYSAEVVEVKSGVACGNGWVSIQEFPDYFQITTGNRIRHEHGPKLISYCKEINSFNETQLRKLKRDIRSQALERDTGAQIGLIQTSIISGNKLDFKILSDESDFDFFIISTRTSKEVTATED